MQIRTATQPSISINDLMMGFSLQRKDKSDISIIELLDYFADKIKNKMVVLDTEGNANPLTWEMINKFSKHNIIGISLQKKWQRFSQEHKPDSIKKRRQVWHHYYFSYARSEINNLANLGGSCTK